MPRLNGAVNVWVAWDPKVDDLMVVGSMRGGGFCTMIDEGILEKTEKTDVCTRFPTTGGLQDQSYTENMQLTITQGKPIASMYGIFTYIYLFSSTKCRYIIP